MQLRMMKAVVDRIFLCRIGIKASGHVYYVCEKKKEIILIFDNYVLQHSFSCPIAYLTLYVYSFLVL